MSEVDNQKLLALLGLARRAGKLALGFSAVEQLVRKPGRTMVIAASDMGAAQKSKVQRFENLAGLVDDALTGRQMAAAFGREKLVIAGVNDPGFVKGIKKLLDAPSGGA
ncbi:hypothetical protein CSA17_02690 [bacterium DOLJORAL78_65_58]|nr:MAG: hypothetical protein CSB20_12405 [bacterium DOLZORAL124_64_63]PIE76344.1 MAG: hypothetical protein CSA17_02690 [bacterium DOLJORAL78_65_58]